MLNRTLITLGIVLIAIGVAWPYVVSGFNSILGLPGNFEFHKGGFHFYFPLTLCLILSIIFSLILMFIKR